MLRIRPSYHRFGVPTERVVLRGCESKCAYSAADQKMTDGFIQKVEKTQQKKKTILLFKIMETFFTDRFWKKNSSQVYPLIETLKYFSIKAQ